MKYNDTCSGRLLLTGNGTVDKGRRRRSGYKCFCLNVEVKWWCKNGVYLLLLVKNICNNLIGWAEGYWVKHVKACGPVLWPLWKPLKTFFKHTVDVICYHCLHTAAENTLPTVLTWIVLLLNATIFCTMKFTMLFYSVVHNSLYWK